MKAELLKGIINCALSGDSDSQNNVIERLTPILEGATSLNMHVHVDSDERMNLMIAPRDRSGIANKLTVISTDPRGNPASKFQGLGISSGLHVAIDNNAFWDGQAEFVWKSVKIIPYETGRVLDIAALETVRMNLPRRFSICVNSDDRLTVEIWKGASPTDIRFDTLPQNPLPSANHASGGSHWKFVRNQPEVERFVAFSEMPELIISFKEEIVKDYILITRTHKGNHKDYYLLVSRKQSTL